MPITHLQIVRFNVVENGMDIINIVTNEIRTKYNQIK